MTITEGGEDLARRIASLSPAQRALFEQKLRESATAEPPGADGTRAVSPAQRRQWFLEQLGGDSGGYNVWDALRLVGPLEPAALGHALHLVAARHESLRATFRLVDGEPLQVVAPALHAEVDVIPVAGEAEARRLSSEIAHRRFDLLGAPPWRLALLRLGPADHVLLLAMHHIISDIWSRRVFFRDLGVAYSAVVAGREPKWAPLAVQYPAVAPRQGAELDSAAQLRQLDYWTHVLRGAPKSLDLPTDRTRPAVQTGRGGEVLTVIPAETVRALERLGQEEGATLFMVLAAGFAALLARYAGQDVLVLGTPVAGRSRPELEELIGFLVNTLALRIDLRGEPTFRELLRRVRDMALGAYANQDVPFERVVEAVRPARDMSRAPVFQVMLALHNVPEQPPAFAGIEVGAFDVASRAVPFDMYLTFVPAGAALRGFLRYSTDLWDPATMDRMLGEHLGRLLTDAARRPDQPWTALELLGAEERRLVVEEWNRTATPYPRDATIPALVAEHATRTPDAVAVEMGTTRVTYGDLVRRAASIATALRARGVEPGTRVGIAADRSPATIGALLGILQAGGAYVPLDAEYPRERLRFLVRDAGAPLVLASAGTAARLAELGASVAVIEDLERASPSAGRPAGPAVGADTVAYVIYTSGSTGEPKGVEVTHRNVVRLVHGQGYARFGSDRVFLHASPLSFDASTFEIWGALLHGARLVVYPERVPTARELAQLIRGHGVTTAWLTAQLFNAIVDDAPEALGGLRQLLAGGEALSPTHVRRALAAWPGTELVNGYGPTECTTFACCYPIPRELAPAAASIPIGRPIANTRAYVLDARGGPVPIGVPGELYLGGDGVARGYLGRPELTRERFIADPFDGAAGGRLYRTGDVCRWRSDGTIEFLGRVDRQVKLRGFRIEPGEIETVLHAVPGVAEAAVVVREDQPGQARLVAYVVPDPDEIPAVDDLRTRVRDRLPEHMHPSSYVYIEALPVTPNGKLDRRALPVPQAPSAVGVVAPADRLEVQLAAIWERVLGVAPISVEASFFDLGGHSLLSLKLFSEIERDLGRRLPLSTLFRLPTVRALAGALRDARWVPARSILVPIRPAGTRIPFFCVHGLGGNVVGQRDLALLLGEDQPFYGLQAALLDERPRELPSVEQIAARYLAEIRSVQPKGPYALGGFCFGGLVAFEMARHLVAAGECVGLLALLDPPVPIGRDGLRKRTLRASSRALGLLGLQRPRRLVGHTWIRKVHSNAIASYRPRPYSGAALLFATTHHHGVRDAPVRPEAWARFVVGGLESYILEGDHRLIIVQPMVRTVAAKIREHLDALNRG